MNSKAQVYLVGGTISYDIILRMLLLSVFFAIVCNLLHKADSVQHGVVFSIQVQHSFKINIADINQMFVVINPT